MCQAGTHTHKHTHTPSFPHIAQPVNICGVNRKPNTLLPTWTQTIPLTYVQSRVVPCMATWLLPHTHTPQVSLNGHKHTYACLPDTRCGQLPRKRPCGKELRRAAADIRPAATAKCVLPMAKCGSTSFPVGPSDETAAWLALRLQPPESPSGEPS